MESSNIFRFTLKQFISFLKENNVVAIAIASVISERVTDLTNTAMNGLVLPVLNRDADGDGKADIKTIENMCITIGGMNFKLGEVAVSLLKFIIITYVIFVISNMLKKIEASV